MSAHQGYLDRMTARLVDIEHEIKALAEKVARDGDAAQQRQLRELEASLAVAKDRLQASRMAAAEASDEMTQSVTQSFARVQTALGRTRAAIS
jgi:chromosome segregation ATPase